MCRELVNWVLVCLWNLPNHLWILIKLAVSDETTHKKNMKRYKTAIFFVIFREIFYFWTSTYTIGSIHSNKVSIDLIFFHCALFSISNRIWFQFSKCSACAIFCVSIFFIHLYSEVSQIDPISLKFLNVISRVLFYISTFFSALFAALPSFLGAQQCCCCFFLSSMKHARSSLKKSIVLHKIFVSLRPSTAR